MDTQEIEQRATELVETYLNGNITDTFTAIRTVNIEHGLFAAILLTLTMVEHMEGMQQILFADQLRRRVGT